jgi:hypothetical protein
MLVGDSDQHVEALGHPSKPRTGDPCVGPLDGGDLEAALPAG